MKGLTPELIAQLAAGRTRNTYGPKVKEFSDSDEAMVSVKENWPVELGPKDASTLYQGFRNAVAKAKLEEVISVKRSGDDVYLAHNERVKLVLEAMAENSTNGHKK